MTRQESFKRRVRARMERTGERYNAARRVLIEQAQRGGPRVRAAEPELGDEAVRAATGRDWDQWCDVIDAWEGRDRGHSAIVAHLHEAHGVEGWWAQTVSVGYERITGRRMPHQRQDGTFTVNKSRTLTTDPSALRDLLLREDDRADLFPGLETELRSRPTSKNVRLRVGPGVAEFAMAPLDDGRVRITIAHERLPSADDVEEWRAYWGDWLEAVDQG